MDQTSQAAVNLDLPPPEHPQTTSNVEQMEVDYGPALPPHLGADHHQASDQPSSSSKSLLRRLQIHLQNTLTLIGSMILNRGLPWINTMMNPMNLGFHFLNPKNMLTRVNIRLGPDTCHLPHRRISSLYPDTGLIKALWGSAFGGYL